MPEKSIWSKGTACMSKDEAEEWRSSALWKAEWRKAEKDEVEEEMEARSRRIWFLKKKFCLYSKYHGKPLKRAQGKRWCK